MKKLWILPLLGLLAGCAAPKVDLNANQLKTKQKQRYDSANQQVKDQTGTDLGTTKPQKRKFGIPTAPVDP